jgi:hypothetical protein
MNTKQLVAALAITLGATSAFAIEATQWNPPPGTKTRAEVVAELKAAQASGQMNNRQETYDGTNYQTPTSTTGTLSRAQVQAEGTAANHAHRFNSDYVD